MSRLSAAIARCLGAVRWPLHSYPTALAFANRRELLLGGLIFVDRICVEGDAEHDLAVSLGVRPAQVEIMPPSSPVEAWRRLYDTLG